ncbi:hypothetical protein FOZ63_023930, partial [Perkinsus olseni]
TGQFGARLNREVVEAVREILDDWSRESGLVVDLIESHEPQPEAHPTMALPQKASELSRKECQSVEDSEARSPSVVDLKEEDGDSCILYPALASPEYPTSPIRVMMATLWLLHVSHFMWDVITFPKISDLRSSANGLYA